MKKTIFKTGLTIFAIGAMSLVGFNAAYGYGGSGGSSSCSSVSYGEWGKCVNGTQYRDVVSTNPRQCDLSASQQLKRSQICFITGDESGETVNNGNGQVSGQKQYANGTLLRTPDGKVYVVENGALKHVSGPTELKKKYAGKEIINVDDAEIFAFVQGIVKGDQKYSEGTLLRGTDGKVYVIVGGSIKHIVHLDTLKKYYAGREILNVDNSVINFFGGQVLGSKKYSNGTLLRGSDGKVYVVVDNTLMHIPTPSELRKNYAGREILNVSDQIIKDLK